MRDLKADLEICNRATQGPWNIYNINNAEFITAAREGWPHAIERAIKAEAEVERLRMALDKIANPLKYMQMEARAKGAELNDVYAIMLSKDPSYLQEIALAALREQVERVLCAKCKYYNKTGCSAGFGWCENMDRGTHDEFYCANGTGSIPWAGFHY